MPHLLSLKCSKERSGVRACYSRDLLLHLESHVCKGFPERFDPSDATLFLTRTLAADHTHRSDDGWKAPLCAEKSFAV